MSHLWDEARAAARSPAQAGDTEPVPEPGSGVAAMLELLDGLKQRGLLERCTRVTAGSAAVELSGPPAPVEDPDKAQREREKLDAETLFGAS